MQQICRAGIDYLEQFLRFFSLITNAVNGACWLKWKGLSFQVSGISTEIFKQIETVENDHDASTAAALESVERRGEMVVRVIEPRQMGRQAADAAKKFIAMQVVPSANSFHFFFSGKERLQPWILTLKEN